MSVITNTNLQAIVDNTETKREIVDFIKANVGSEGEQEQLVQFINASNDVTKLSAPPSNDDKLELYGLYKRGLGAKLDKPGMFDFIAKKKYAAWESHGDLTATEAQAKYVAHVKNLLALDKPEN
ncbi:acyl CoA binding protein-domain-containing protein [Kickxella alabastrina]|uniref:acyl CoA binding protein-domain-containing protein n=1 Tax=Kickxella alabastrina TaxID=61397 RepID=UPI00221F329F|nr:acyl CoA binding protein-domain-containing protein [Kickxella alabastrina]KAI7834064.1 acyl CoA binding protein-domain-containing protein [Kickxella alabastrina]